MTKNKSLYSLLIFLLTLIGFSPSTQATETPTKWGYSAEIVSQKRMIYDLHIKVRIQDGWKLYAQEISEAAAERVQALAFEFNPEQVQLMGGTQEVTSPTEMVDEALGDKVAFFEGSAHFRQRVRLQEPIEEVEGSVAFSLSRGDEMLSEKRSFTIAVGKITNSEMEDEEASTSNNTSQSSFQAVDGDDVGQSAQKGGIIDPTKWSSEIVELEDGSAKVVISVEIEENWHLYGLDVAEGGPVPTSFTVTPEGALRSPFAPKDPPIETFDQVFEMEVTYFEDHAVFEATIDKESVGPSLEVEVEFMLCDDSRCLPPDVETFSFDTENLMEEGKDNSFWNIFIVGFLGGFIAILTPCVFPMIPLTVSFFTKNEGKSRAVLYGFFIVLIYVSLGFLITRLYGPDALNAMAAHPFWNTLFFIIFFVFALSFFGAFDLTLPSGFINKVDSLSDKGGIIGVFFMAFTLALVSFSCTGPIIGTLLVEIAHSGSETGPIVGMFGFSLALALPFTLFAVFPSWLNTLPQSGGWLNSVKVVLGFLELALAMKFISIVDLVFQWGIITREVFIVVWIVIFAMMGFYLLGKIRFAHDVPIDHISIPRLLLSILTFSFVIYLVPGLWGAPLKLISGFPPPSFYAEWKQDKNVTVVSGSGESQTSSAHHETCPHNLNCFHDYDQGMAYAKEVNKPVLLDFTGWSCVNCRKMEDKVWIESNVMERIANEYVLISLYVDDREVLPAAEQYVSDFSGKKVRTVGNKWSDFQMKNYGQNSQPLYVLLDTEGNKLADPVGYTPNVREYVNFLDKGLRAFEK